jgi:hypothetical protein
LIGFVVAGVDDPGTALWLLIAAVNARGTAIAASAYLSFPQTAQWFPMVLAYSMGSARRDDRLDL